MPSRREPESDGAIASSSATPMRMHSRRSAVRSLLSVALLRCGGWRGRCTRMRQLSDLFQFCRHSGFARCTRWVGALPMPSESDSPDVHKAQTFFQYGNDAALKSNIDYAIDMYKQACKIVPDNLTYRQALRGVQRRKFNNEPSKVGMLAGARNQPIRMRARSARGKGNYAHALEVCEEAFTHNPWDVADGARGLRGGRAGRLPPARGMVPGIGSGPGQRRRVLPPRRACVRAQ